MASDPRLPVCATALVASLCLGLSMASADSAHAAPPASVSLDDPRYDDTGSGRYVYPSGGSYRPGQFDLRRLEVSADGDDIVFRVSLAAPLRKPAGARVSDARALELRNGIYVQNVDIYVDSIPGVGRGFTDGIPGRRISFDPAQAWDVAIVLTPQPYPVRAIVEDWHPAGPQVVVPANVRSAGSTLVARVPAERFGGPLDAGWGFAVTVSGAAWQPSFDAVDRLTGTHRLDAYTLPVHTVAEDGAFGGGTVGGNHPQVIDILVPPGVSQKATLGAHDARSGRLARVPMVYARPEAARALGVPPAALAFAPRSPTPARSAASGVPASALAGLSADSPTPVGGSAESHIRDVLDTTVVIANPPGGLAQFRLAAIHGPDGARVGKVVVMQVHPEFVTATIVEGLGAIRKGMAVRFTDPEE